MQSTSDLPVELVCDIVSLAARHAVLHDRTWLCTLALTSRFVCDLVRPVLYETVTITSYNIAGVIASVESESAHWQLTKHLLIDDSRPPLHYKALALAGAFSGVRHMISTLNCLKAFLNAHVRFRPTRFTSTDSFHPHAWTPECSGITHLHFVAVGRLDYVTPPVPPPLSGALTHVVVQLDPFFARRMVPWFLASPTIQRVAIWVPRYVDDCPEDQELVTLFASLCPERRISVIRNEERNDLVVQAEGHDADIIPDIVTFDPALWHLGREIRW